MASYSFLEFFPSFQQQEHEGWNHIFGDPLLNSGAHVGITHLVFTGVLVALVVVLALIARRKYRSRKTALIPEGKLTISGFFEVAFDAILNMMSEMMGEEEAKKYFPLIAALGVFIFFGNAMGLVPGFAHPTSNLNTGAGCAVVVFVVYNISGVIDQGPIEYIKHFMGPVLLLAPFIFIIEVVSHIFRPISLAVRLTGNMTGDGLLLEIFGDLGAMMVNAPVVLPIPFLFLGLLVSGLQALIFCVLSTAYIALAIEDEH